MNGIEKSVAKNEIYIPTGKYAQTRSQRRRGLSRISIEMSPSEMIFERCRSVHTFGMRFNLQVIFVDSNYVVLEQRTVKPRRIVFGPRGTFAIIERPLR